MAKRKNDSGRAMEIAMGKGYGNTSKSSKSESAKYTPKVIKHKCDAEGMRRKER